MIDLYLKPYFKTAESTIIITSILKNFKSLIKQVYEKKCTQKYKKKMDQNIYFRVDINQRQEKLLTLKKKIILVFNNKQNSFFSKLTRFKSKTDILHTFIVRKIPTKVHEVADC